MRRSLWLIMACALLHSFGALAQPGRLDDTPSADPQIEAQVQAVADTLRCVVCKNQSIADSDAGLARDMVALVREQIEAGATEDEARDYMVERYGEFVLLQPTWTWKNAGLWLGPVVVLLLGAAFAVMFVRRRGGALATPDAPVALTPAEEDELRRRLSGAPAEPDTPV